MNRDINTAFLRIARRAEANERAKLVDTFVDAGPLFTLLGSPDHQILYGRRGTGKTHALIYLGETQAHSKHAVVYLDMRTVGSTGGIYSDPNTPIAERATRLLMDTLAGIHNGLYEFAVETAHRTNLSVVGPLLDQLAEAITQVVVVGEITQESTKIEKDSNSQQNRIEAVIKPSEPALSAKFGDTLASERQIQRSYSETGTSRHRVHFGAVGSVLSDLAKAVSPSKLWILLDEWSVVPLDLQPLLADLLRRSLLPVTGVVVKIGAN